MKTFSYQSLDELTELIPIIWDEIQDYRIILLSGNLGSGKTTFVQKLAKYLHFEDQVSSPTFTLINEYRDESQHRYFHMDMYRLKSVEEAIDLGIEEYLFGESICFIEWPEIILDILPPKFVHLKITQDAVKRDLEIEING